MYEFATIFVDPGLVVLGGFLVGLAAGRHWIFVAAGAVLVAVWWSQNPIEGAGPWFMAILGGSTFALLGALGGIARVKLPAEWGVGRSRH